ncbi:MAG: ABC transporter ATP-binding protein [Pyrinomonadaceae bacterium]|nr:ABC transporter ATP-binding protein [Phycisphaerales bacterium]
MITARNISKWYGGGAGGNGVRAVRDVSFEVHAGQIVGLLGPNGAGKTTTLRMITGYLPPSLGTISVAGHDTISESIQARRALGYLPEAAPLYLEMRVIDYLKYRARLYGVSVKARKPAISRVLDRCWLTPVSHRRVGQLSKGFKQRVGLAGAMLHDPQVLILDEPTSGLDPTQIRETRSLIRELAHKRTVIVSSHILPEVEKTCDRVLIIARGTLRADGAPEALLAPLREVSPYVVEVPAGAASPVRQALAALPDIHGVELGSSDTGWTWIRVIPKAGARDMREPIAQAIVQIGAQTAATQGGPVFARELRRETPTLEQLFFRIIEEDQESQKKTSSLKPPISS